MLKKTFLFATLLTIFVFTGCDRGTVRRSGGEIRAGSGAGDNAAEPITVRHILITYKGAKTTRREITRSREEARALAEKVARELKGGADFAALAEKHSDCLSAQVGGGLGRIRPGTREEAFEQAVSRAPEVVECHNITGTIEYLLRVECADLASYKQFHTETLGTTPHVTSITSYVVMGSPKDLRA